MLNHRASSTQITHGQRLWLYVLVALVMAFLVIPCLIIIPLSFSDSQYLEFPPRGWSLRWYEAFFTSDEWLRSAIVSLKVASSTTILATVLGTLASYGLHKRAGGFNAIVRGALILPMMVPLIFVAIGAFLVYARLNLNNTLTGLVLAHTTLAIPFV
ncbi:ABC transporter permease, partial [Mesorhizobium sp. M4A.F.Ca.ET.020.02.1.1]